MSIDCMDNSSQFYSLSDRLTDTVYWMGISIVKIMGVAVAVFICLEPHLYFGQANIDKALDLARHLGGLSLITVVFLGAFKIIRDIFRFCTQENMHRDLSKPINQAVQLN